MLLVVYFHCICYYWQWNFNGLRLVEYGLLCKFLNYIHMPMFVFVSGFLYAYLYIEKKRYCTFRNLLQAKYPRLLVPYIIWGVLLCLLIPNRYSITMLFTGISHLWFLLMLFGVFVIAHLLRNYWSVCSFRQSIYIIVALVVVYNISVPFTSHLEILGLHNVLRYLPFFILGISMYRFPLIIRKQRLILILSMFFLGLNTIIYFTQSITIVKLCIDALSYSVALFMIPFLYTIVSDFFHRRKPNEGGGFYC